MDSLSLKLDFYSFFLGTQVSAVSRLLTPAAYLGPCQYRRGGEYLDPILYDRGSMIFLYRTRDPGNFWLIWKRILIRVFERNLMGGCLYILMEKYLQPMNDNVKNAMIHGGLLGTCLSWKNSFENDNFSLLRCAFVTGQVAGRGEWLRQMVISKMKDAVADQFSLDIPWWPNSFLNGAITGSVLAVALYTSDIRVHRHNMDYITIPEFDEDDDRADRILKYSIYGTEVFLSLTEKFIVGGVIFYGSELFVRKVIGLDSDFVIVPFCGSAIGLYAGIATGRYKESCKLSLALSSLSYISLNVLPRFLPV